MTTTTNCTVVGQHWDSDRAEHSYDKEYAYAGKNANERHVYCLKFTTPSFNGTSTNISLGMSFSKAFAEKVNLRYALCTSDAGYESYYYTDNAVSDSYQITSGDKTMTSLTTEYKTYTFNISTDVLKPNTTYYFYLWGYNSAVAEGLMLGINTIANHIITVTYEINAVIYIDNGSSFDAYEIWIDNGSTWEQYAAYIDNGSSWDECG